MGVLRVEVLSVGGVRCVCLYIRMYFDVCVCLVGMRVYVCV